MEQKNRGYSNQINQKSKLFLHDHKACFIFIDFSDSISNLTRPNFAEIGENPMLSRNRKA